MTETETTGSARYSARRSVTAARTSSTVRLPAGVSDQGKGDAAVGANQNLFGQILLAPDRDFENVSGHESIILRHLQQWCGICLIGRRAINKDEHQ